MVAVRDEPESGWLDTWSDMRLLLNLVV
jgi:hypothetical protein